MLISPPGAATSGPTMGRREAVGGCWFRLSAFPLNGNVFFRTARSGQGRTDRCGGANPLPRGPFCDHLQRGKGGPCGARQVAPKSGCSLTATDTHVGGRKSGRWNVFCYQFGGSSNSAEALAPGGGGEWRCLTVEKLSQVELHEGEWHTEPRSRRQTCIDEIDFDVDAQPGEEPQ